MKIQEIETRLLQKYPEAQVFVQDLTGGEDHFEIRIRAQDLNSLSRIQQHKEVMAPFDKELKSGEIHALSIKVVPV